jgi:hypothetical protein
MAGGAIIGSLRVILGADTAALEKGLKDSQSSLAAFGSAVATGMAAAAVAVAAAGAAIGVAMRNTINDMDQLAKTSQKIGVPVEQLSSLAYAADLSDVSFEALSKSVAKLNKAMVEAAAKPTSEAANAFRALGVSVTDSSGRLKSSDAVMADIAGKFEGLKDGAGKTAVAMAIFGKAGADLIPLLNGGRDSLKEMNAEAETFGAIVSTKAAKEAEAFNDNITRLGYAVKGVFVQAVSSVLPTLVEVSNRMVDTAKNSGILQVAVDAVSTAMKGLVTGGVIVGAVFKSLAEYISTVSSALSMVLKGEFAAAFSAVKGGVSGITENATAAFGTIDNLWKGQQAGAEAAAASTQKAATAQKDFNFAALGGKNAVDQFIASQMKGLAGQQAEIQTFGMLAGAKEAAKLQLQALTIAQQNNTTISAAQQLQLDLLKQKTTDYAMTLAGLQLAQANLTPAQLFQQEQMKIQALFDAGKISAETYGAAMQKVAENANATWAQAGESMAGSFAQIAGAFGKESKGMAVAAKVFGVIQGTISMFTGAAKALELPFPANLAAMATVLAKGASLVASIKSQSVPSGLAMGGAFRVPGGVGGGDKVPFQAMLEPGELVEVSSNRAGGYQSGTVDGGKSQAGGPRSVTLQGFMWGRDQMRDLFDFLNEGMRDGHKLDVKFA